jgi:uncharacterized protein (TIGR03067 family)
MKTFLAACLVIVSCAVSSPAADDAPSGDLAKLQGKWKGTVGPNQDIPLVMELKGKAVTLALTIPQGQDLELKGQVKLDDKAKPKTWDWIKFTRPDGEDAPDNLALYELDGDTLKICSGGPGNARPTEFKAGDGGPPQIVTLTRVKDGSKEK